MTTIADAEAAPASDKSVPLDELGRPLRWDGNYARVPGLLSQANFYYVVNES